METTKPAKPLKLASSAQLRNGSYLPFALAFALPPWFDGSFVPIIRRLTYFQMNLAIVIIVAGWWSTNESLRATLDLEAALACGPRHASRHIVFKREQWMVGHSNMRPQCQFGKSFVYGDFHSTDQSNNSSGFTKFFSAETNFLGAFPLALAWATWAELAKRQPGKAWLTGLWLISFTVFNT